MTLIYFVLTSSSQDDVEGAAIWVRFDEELKSSPVLKEWEH